MASSPDLTSMALFCDFENVALGVRDTHHEKFDIKLVLERLLLKGSIVVKKAYCDWDRYKGFKATMHEANFELIEIPHVRQSGKNSADIRLVVDALDLCYTKAHVNTFVIISGDSDFSPLVSKLRENNKQVIGVGVKQSTSDLLTANCDEFIFYDDLVREGQRTSTRRAPAPPAPRRQSAPAANPEEERRREETEVRRTKAVDLAVQTFEALYSERGDGGKIWASVLKEAIKRRKPDFSESYFGFRSFGGLLEEAQARGFLEMGRDEKSNAFVFRSSTTGAHAASQQAPQASDQAAAPAVPAAPEVLPVTHRAGESEQRERRGPRQRGGRRGAPDRHDFEPTVVVEEPSAAVYESQPSLLSQQEQEDDDAAERFADAARDSLASRDAGPVASPADADAHYEVDPDGLLLTDEDAFGPREVNSRRGNRGGRGGRNAARKNAGAPQAPQARQGGNDQPPAARQHDPRPPRPAPTPELQPSPAPMPVHTMTQEPLVAAPRPEPVKAAAPESAVAEAVQPARAPKPARSPAPRKTAARDTTASTEPAQAPATKKASAPAATSEAPAKKTPARKSAPRKTAPRKTAGKSDD